MTGLILEGGGLRALFSAGVMDVWMEHGIKFDGIIGVSAGATFGCNYKSEQPGRAFRYNIRFRNDPRYMSVGSFLKTGDFVNAAFSYHYMPEKLDVFDSKAFAANPAAFWIVATDVETGEPCYKRLDEVNDDMLEWLRASASLPILSNPVARNGRQYLDGGIADSIPLRFFQTQGYTRNVVILSQPANYRKKKTTLIPIFKMAMRRFPAITEAMKRRHVMYNEELDYLASEQQKGNTLAIYPDKKLPIGRISHSKEKMTDVYEIGRRVGMETLDAVRSFVEAT